MAGPEVPFPMKVPFPRLLEPSVAPMDGPHFTAVRFPGEGGIVHVTAVGVNPTGGYLTAFFIGPELIFPPRLHFANVPPSGLAAQIVTPFKVDFAYSHPRSIGITGIEEPEDFITVYTVSGPVTVEVRDAGFIPSHAGNTADFAW